MCNRDLFSVAMVAVFVGLAGCSSAPNSGQAAATNTGGGTLPCTGDYCLEADVRIVAEPSPLVFTDITAGQEEYLKLRVRNIGASGMLDIQSAVFDPPAPAFVVVNFAAAKVKPGEWVDWQVRYRPVGADVKQTKLIITNNSSNDAEKKYAVNVSVQAASGALTIKPDPVDFGVVESGSTETRTVKLFNTGEHPLTIVAAELPPNGSQAFKISKHPDYATPIAPSSSDELEITFKPDLGGTYSTQLIVTDSNKAVSTVHVFGEENAPMIGVIPPALNYGVMKEGDKATKTLKVVNNGTAPLKVSELKLAASSVFKNVLLSDAGPFTVGPNSSRAVDVTLTAGQKLPMAAAPIATIEVFGNGANTDKIDVPMLVVGEPCKESTSSIVVEAVEKKGATDIIWFVDTSGSMKAEAAAVQMGINAFATFIGGKAIDYHVIMIANTKICVPPPLASAGCTDSSGFKHVNESIGSNDGLKKVIQSYPQWKSFLRPNASQHYVVVTDDNSKMSDTDFKSGMQAVGAPGFPNGFTFHSIIATGATPAQTIPFVGCIGGAGHGVVYEALSKSTGGIIQSICGLQDWTKVFNAIASNVAASVKAVKCNYNLPATGDKDKIAMSFKNSSGGKVTVKRVQDAGACPANSHGWYFDDNNSPTSAILCKTTCNAKQGQKLSFVYGC